MNSNGSGHIANGSNVTRNRPESPQLETDRIDEAKNVQIARSTDLIFLKSVVASNTLERTKKVCCFFISLSFSCSWLNNDFSIWLCCYVTIFNLGYSPGLIVTTLFPSPVLRLERSNIINLGWKVTIMVDILAYSFSFTNQNKSIPGLRQSLMIILFLKIISVKSHWFYI